MRLSRTVAVVLSFLVVLPVAASNEREILLRTPPVTPPGKDDADKTVKRSRFVDVNVAALLRSAMGRGERKEETQLLSMTLFPDVTFDVKLTHVERTPIGSIAWTGVVEGEPLSSVLLSVAGNSIHGSISIEEKRYAIESTKHGLHRVTELDPTTFPAELDPHLLPPVAGAHDAAVVWTQDTGSRIDVLVAYTTTVRTVLGGTSAAEALATNAVNATNTAYTNSGVTPRLRLVGTVEVTHNEATDFSTALSQLRSTSDGQMDNVHPLRESLGADAVALIVDKTGACGIGYVMVSVSTSFASAAFSVTDHSCAVGNFSFAHELGHNFGLAHDRANSGGPASSNYSYGYQDPQGGFRDIMAYPNGCPGQCPRIQYFSNPDITFMSRPLGVDHLLSNAADNRRALNENAFAIANFRQEVSSPTPVTFTDDPLVAGTTRVKALHITELRTAINTKRTQAGLGAFSWSAAPVSGGPILASHIAELRTALAALGVTANYTDPTLTPGTTRIKAVHIQELRDSVK